MKKLLIGHSSPRTYAVLEDGHLTEWIVEHGDVDAGELFLGRVERIVPGMSAAFIDIGQEKNGFLPITDQERSILRCGESILVQIKRQAQGMKGAFLTRNIVFAGEYLLFLPFDREIGVSARITAPEDRERLHALGRNLSAGTCGLVMRTSSLDASEEMLKDDLLRLQEQWQIISREIRNSTQPRHLDGVTFLSRLLDDLIPRGLDGAVTADPLLARELEKRCSVELCGSDPLSDPGLLRERDQALQRHLYLKNGSSLVIDECEALSVIDVNTQKYTGHGRKAATTLYQTNLDACPEIVHQIRLRNLCGIILIDMIDMTSDEERTAVLRELERCFQKDRIKTVIHGFTSLGLVEITRKRTMPSLREQTCRICAHCRGFGYTLLEERNG